MGWQKSLLSLSEPKIILKVVNWLKIPSVSLYVVNRKRVWGRRSVLEVYSGFFSFSSVTLMINELTILVVALVFGQHYFHYTQEQLQHNLGGLKNTCTPGSIQMYKYCQRTLFQLPRLSKKLIPCSMILLLLCRRKLKMLLYFIHLCPK